MIAALFPGQGSQVVGMGRELLDGGGAGRETLERAFDVLRDLRPLMLDGPPDALQLTENAQPALVAHGVAAYRAWCARRGRGADLAAGHSLGEFAAHVAAGSLELDDALRLVRARGRSMQAAVPVGEGAMAAVLKLEPDEVRACCRAASAAGVVEVANLNAPGQTVISGHKAAVAEASERARARGGRAVPLNVSAPFHSSLMAPARERLARELSIVEFRDPRFPVVANVTARPVRAAHEIRRLLAEQVTAPVRWVECVRTLWELGARTFVEFGPGTAVSGMVKRILPDARTLHAATPGDLDALAEALP